MSQTHIHLLITHLPIYGSILGAFVLAYGLFTFSHQTKMAAYGVFIICALGAGAAYITGEAAEETVETIAGISENMVEEHEEAGLFALIAMITLGVLSIAGIILAKIKPAFTRSFGFFVLLISLISFGIAARTGFLGGQIRHTEIHSTPVLIQEDDD